MSETVKFTLDGEDVEAESGLTIWEAAHRSGLRIPQLCHKPAPGYRPDGNCRACMVKIEGERMHGRISSPEGVFAGCSAMPTSAPVWMSQTWNGAWPCPS